MRVVQMVCSDGFGGVEQYILNLAHGLVSQGAKVDVIGGSSSRMQESLRDSRASWSNGDDPRQAWRSLRSLPRPDLVVSHMSQADLVATLYRRSGRGRGVPQLSTRHFAAPRGHTGAARVLFRAVAAGIAGQLSVSEYVAGEIDGDSVVVHSGVAERDEQMQREQFVLVAQRLEQEKDTETTLRAWAASSARQRGWRMQIAGDGSQRSELESMAGALGIDDSVDFLGFRRDVQDLLSRAGLVLAPTPREGLGILVLEAMAAGTPVVASAGGGHLETVGAVSPETLFVPGDARSAAAIIDALVVDNTRRDAVGQALQRLQRERFTIDRQVAGTFALYEKVRS